MIFTIKLTTQSDLLVHLPLPCIILYIVYYGASFVLISGDERIFTLESLPQEATLPPLYSGLSVHLLPTYSQACRIIGYNRPSSESITRTEPYLE